MGRRHGHGNPDHCGGVRRSSDCAGFPVTSKEVARDLYEVELDKQMSKNISKVIIGLVDDLKKAGYEIEDDWIHNNGKKYKQYRIVGRKVA